MDYELFLFGVMLGGVFFYIFNRLYPKIIDGKLTLVEAESSVIEGVADYKSAMQSIEDVINDVTVNDSDTIATIAETVKTLKTFK